MGQRTYKPILTDTIKAAADLPKKRFVGFTGNLCAANAKALGVTELAHNSGDFASVVAKGIMIVETGGAITVGAPVASDSTGRAVAATAFSAAVPAGATPVTSDATQPNLTEAGGYLPQHINGYAMDAATGAGEFIRVLLP